jgi:hypothetical protein
MAAEPQTEVDAKPCEERASSTTVSSSGNDSPLNLKSIKVSPGVESDVFAILVSLVESPNLNSQTIQDAVDGIDRLFPKTPEPSRLLVYGDEDHSAADFLWMFWELLLEVVRQIPYNHVEQEIFIDFLKRLRQKDAGAPRVWGVCVSYNYSFPSHVSTIQVYVEAD